MNPTVSYIIPTYYREELLAPQLQAFAFQTDRDFEVIISDDGAEKTWASDLAQKYGATYIWNPRGPMYWLTRTVNAGFRQARGQWLVVLTNGCVPARNLTAEVKKLERNVLWTITWNHIGGDTSFGIPARTNWAGESITDELLAHWEANLTADWRTVGPESDAESLAVWSRPGSTNRHIRNFCIGGALLHRNVLGLLGSMDETYQGYGCEDGAWAATAVKKFRIPIGYTPNILMHHLPHPRPDRSGAPDVARVQAERAKNWERLIREHPGIWI
jgi:hypothetical protein